jgi:6-pyruvoyltetrahydropterin/6-carboxytetrahydropterin synthase
MFRVTREFHFCYGHRLLNYDGKCKYLHGHNGKAIVTLEGPQLDALGMVMDFSQMKKVLQKWIDDTIDHKMMLHRDDPVLKYLQERNEPVVVLDVNPTAENIAKLICDYAISQGFPVTEVKLWETDSCYATYVP